MNKEIFDKVSKCKTVEEVLELAKSNGKNITKEQAKTAFDKTHLTKGELSDEEISNVSGGGGLCHEVNTYSLYEKTYFRSFDSIEWIFCANDEARWVNIKNKVEAPVRVIIVHRRAEGSWNGPYDLYSCKRKDNGESMGYYTRDYFVNEGSKTKH